VLLRIIYIATIFDPKIELERGGGCANNFGIIYGRKEAKYVKVVMQEDCLSVQVIVIIYFHLKIEMKGRVASSASVLYVGMGSCNALTYFPEKLLETTFDS